MLLSVAGYVTNHLSEAKKNADKEKSPVFFATVTTAIAPEAWHAGCVIIS